MRRVVVTARGIVTSLGTNTGVARSLKESRSARAGEARDNGLRPCGT